ncbi:probable ATP-dependent RNA helicase DDX56 [Toxorhynchites rutilus septentrionalis]|uniref:probable ATP-dependent RNA helicase DDX56 n=1 Tax=Toxorhynchites rutilus septentrionalis TaxID=329112 RepID=UPI002479BE6D|nr:probable ATP-dependent RNA helicase DDX56 [Toxorhynchites rutilus septentrionalis]
MSDLDEKKSLNFHQMELDERILKGIAKLGWLYPTLIQETAIPLLLEGKDVLVRARTGSGKTAAFSIPIIQSILNRKRDANEQQTTAVILAPSKDLCHQTAKVIEDLTIKCGRLVRCLDMCSKVDNATLKHMLADRPDILVSTPAKLLAQLQGGNVNVKECLKTLVIDEADLMFSFGFENDLKEVLGFLPNVHQSVLASATLQKDVIELKTIVLHNPVILRLEEPDMAPTSQLSHYHITAEETDKAAILYSLIKLQLIKGKSLIFVNSIDRCYRLKLFLEQFSIRSCILNSELPAKIRCHTVNQFNLGLYDIIIASDELHVLDPAVKQKKASKKLIKKIARESETESGIARGIDFQLVSNVINFDFPRDINSYIHRAGRTARGNNSGNVLSFVAAEENAFMESVEQHLEAGVDSGEKILKNYQFKMEEVEPFRYRAKDAWRAITKFSIREARIKEIKTEMFNSEKLKSFFEDNPRDLQALRHDRTLHTVKVQEHLGDVPEYIVPDALKHVTGITTKRKKSFVPKKRKFGDKANNPLMVEGIDYGKQKKI